MTSPLRSASPARWIRTLPWLAGLLIGASAHLVWWTRTRPPAEPAVHVVTVPGPVVHVHVHSSRRESVEARDSRALARKRAWAERGLVSGARGAMVCGSSGCTIRRTFLAEALHEPGLLGQGLGLRAVRDDGVEGLQLEGVLPASVPDLLGLRSFDTIVAIDGRATRSPTDLAEIVRSLDHAGGFTVNVHRNGLRLTLHHTIVGAVPGAGDPALRPARTTPAPVAARPG